VSVALVIQLAMRMRRII